MHRPSMRLLSSFDGDDPEKLSRQLSQLEMNASDAIDATISTSEPRFAPTNKKTGTYVAKVGDFVQVDSSAVDGTVTLPVATTGNAGLRVAVARLSAANTVTVNVAAGKVNQAASVALAAATRLFLYVSDGVNWWGTV